MYQKYYNWFLYNAIEILFTIQKSYPKIGLAIIPLISKLIRFIFVKNIYSQNKLYIP